MRRTANPLSLLAAGASAVAMALVIFLSAGLMACDSDDGTGGESIGAYTSTDGGTDGGDTDYSQNFVGTWILFEASGDDDSTISPSELAIMRESYNYYVELVFADDGTFQLNYVGDDDTEPDAGTWTATGASEVTLDVDSGYTYDATVEDGRLVLTEDDFVMYFVPEDQYDEFLEAAGGTTPAAEEGSETIDVVAVDDENIRLTFHTKQIDNDGDQVLRFDIENKTDGDITMVDRGASIDGTEYDLVCYTSVEANSTLEDDFVFFQEDTGVTSLDEFTNIQMTLVVRDADGNTIATYEVTVP